MPGFAIDASVIKADANRTRGIAGTEAIDWSRGEGPSRAVREYLATLDANDAEGHATAALQEPATSPKNISLTDPAARWTAAPGGPAFYAYSTNYLIDLQAGIIVDVEATPAYRTQEVDSTRIMIDRVAQRFHLKPQRLVGDTAYGSASMLAWMIDDKAIEPHVPVWENKTRSDDTLPNSDFQWLEQSNEYRCPTRHALRSERRQFPPVRLSSTHPLPISSRQQGLSMRRGVPSLSALQAFEAAARHESFSKAAAELSQTHGAVCKKVNELEAHLGITLFDRVRQRLVLSAAGAEYARRIRVHLDQIRRDTLELMRKQSEVKIQLAVGVTFASQWLIPRLHDFYELNPDLQLHIMGRDQPTFFDNSSFDAAIYFGQSLWPAMPGQPLVSDDKILAVCAPGLNGSRDGLSSEKISALPWIHTRDLPRAWLAWSETASTRVIEHSATNQHYDMFIMAINAAISGLGVALLPRILIDRELRSGALVQVHPHSIPNPESVYYSFPEQKRDWEPLKRFDQWLGAAVRDYREGCRRDRTAAVEAALAPH